MSLLFDLIEPDELDHFMYDIISYEALNKIRFHLIMKLRNMDIPVLKEHIEVKANGNDIDIIVAPELEQKLIELEKNSPEYFI